MWQDITKSSPTNGMASTHAEDARARASRPRHAVRRSSPIDSVHDGQTDRGLPHWPYGCAAADVAHPAVEISPPDTVRRRFIAGHGIAAESVQCISQGVVKYRFRAPMHLLVAYEQGERRDGETFLEGLPRSTLRNFARKLTFVPAGHEYDAWHAPRTKPHFICFYFDPAKLNIHPELGVADISFAPRLFFEDATLWHTVLKLKGLVETPASDDCLYFDSLGIVLVHELARLNRGKPSIEPQVRGGLAAWQQRNVTAYIEEHLAERIPLTTLARLVHLSPYHFCRSFKRSFGMPPHQYQIKRRIDRAKMLLAKRAVSVTDIALSVGFSSSNSFATTFRKVTGCTPTAYHRS
jgi:AraC family transcriptional regulator